ncbi:MAG: hypothetical protein QXP42_02375 [Candidatus Micrarchaeia archaeon]
MATPIEQLVIDHWSAWGSYATLGLLISYFVFALAYMLSQVLRSAELDAWIKNEMWEIIVSTLIVGMLFFAVATIDMLVSAITGIPSGFHNIPGTGDYMPAYQYEAMEFLKLVSDDVIAFYCIGMMVDFFTSLLSGISTGLTIPLSGTLAQISIAIQPFGGFAPVADAYVTVLDTVMLGHIANAAQETALYFISQTMFSFFLPFGVVLRTFALTRRLGSTVIAIAVALYVVYPLCILMEKAMYADFWNRPGGGRERILQSLIEAENTPTLPLSKSEVDDIRADSKAKAEELERRREKVLKNQNGGQQETGRSIRNEEDEYGKQVRAKPEGLATKIVSLLKAWGGPSYVITIYEKLIAYLTRGLVFFVLVATFPIINIIIVVTFVRSLSPTLGGEVQILGMAKVI